MDFYRCFICEFSLKDENEFDEHLKQLSHLRYLEERKMLSSDHLNLLLLIDQFKLEDRKDASTKLPETFVTSKTKVDNPSGSQNVESYQKPQKSFLTQHLTSSGSDKYALDALSIACLTCVKQLSNFNSLKMHLLDGAHEDKKKMSTEMKNLWCSTCERHFDEKELCEHVLVEHFRIPRSFLASRHQMNSNYVCICCGKNMNNINKDHYKSKNHIEKLSTMPIEYYVRCRFCNEAFNSIHNIENHCNSQSHRVREKALKFYHKMFLKKKKKKKPTSN